MSLTLPPAAGHGSRCWYATIKLDEADRAQVDEWLADQDVTSVRIAGALEAYGINESQVRYHRQRHLKTPCR